MVRSYFSLTRRECLVLLLLTVTAFATRFVLFRLEPILEPDAIRYVESGINLVSGRGYISPGGDPEVDEYRGELPPLYPALVGVTSFAIKDKAIVGNIVSVVFGSLLVLLLFFFTRSLYGVKVAFVVACVVVWYPYVANYSSKALTTGTNTFFLVLAAMLGWMAYRERRAWLFGLTGFVFGVSHLARYENFGFVLAYSIWILFVAEFKVALKVLLLTIVFVITIAPFYLYNYRETGSLALIYRLNRTIARKSPVQGVRDASVSGFFLNKEFLKRYIVHLGDSYNRDLPNIFPPLVIAVTAVGILSVWTKYGASWREIYLCAIPIFSLLGVSAIRPGARNLVDSLPFLLVLFSVGVVELGQMIAARKQVIGKRFFSKERNTMAVVLLVVFISTAPFTFRPLLIGSDPLAPLELMEMGKWIAANLPRQQYLLATGRQVAFYAGSRMVLYPADVDDLVKRANELGIQYLVVGSYRAPGGDNARVFFRELGSRLDFELLHELVKPSGWAKLYRIVDRTGLSKRASGTNS